VLRTLTPYFYKLGTPHLRRLIAEYIRLPSFQKARTVVDIIDDRSREIFEQKKAALGSGDEKVVHQLDEQKDIISILSAL
jgi:hypothetical protein